MGQVLFERLIQAVRKAMLLAFSRRAYLFRLKPDLIKLFEADLAHLAGNLGLYYPLEAAPVPGFNGGRILALAAHPDDEAIGAGGGLILAGDAGAEIALAFLTGGASPGEAGRIEAAQRQAEARAAGSFLGASVHLFQAPVRTLSRDRDLAEQAADWIKMLISEFKPQTILAPFPLEAHSDHRAAAWVTARALAGLPAGHRPEPMVWAYEVASLCPANVVVEITGVERRKADLIGLYVSQTARFDYVNSTLGLNRYHSRHVAGRGSYEAFFRAPAHEFIELVGRLDPAQVFKADVDR